MAQASSIKPCGSFAHRIKYYKKYISTKYTNMSKIYCIYSSLPPKLYKQIINFNEYHETYERGIKNCK